jgi:hypothetical protein
MNKIQHLCLSIVMSLLFSNAHADIYRCKDSAGRLITSDKAVPECADKTTLVYSNNGALKVQLPGALTPEQKRAADLQEQQRIKENLAQEQKKKEQRYLLAHYPTEQDVESARQKELDAIDTKIASEKQVIAQTTETLNKKQNKQPQLRKNQTDNLMSPPKTKDDLNEMIQQSNRLIQHYLAEKVETNRRFDETHKRYLEIVGSNKKNDTLDLPK